MYNAYTNPKMSISRFFILLMSWSLLASILRLLIPGLPDALKTILFDAYFSPLILIVVGLYWLRSGLQNSYYTSLKVALNNPKSDQWFGESAVLSVLLVLFFVTTFAVFYILLPSNAQWHYTDLELLKTSTYGNFTRFSIFINCLLTAFVFPLIEELIFRVGFYNRLKVSHSPLKAAILTSSGYMLIHGNPLGGFVMSLVCCLLYDKYQSVWPCILIHSLINLSLVFPIITHIFDGPTTPLALIKGTYMPYALTIGLFSTIALYIYFHKNKPHLLSEL